MTRYSSLCELLEAYRKNLPTPLSQEGLASELGVSVRTYQSWKKVTSFVASSSQTLGRGTKRAAPGAAVVPITRSHLADIARATYLPMEALIRLSHGYPTWVSLTSNRYANGPFDQSFVVASVLRDGLFHVGTDDSGVTPFESGKVLNDFFTFHSRLFKHAQQASTELISEAFERSPMTNLIVRDQDGFYCGHIVTLSLTSAGYERLSSRSIGEGALEIADLARTYDEAAALHIYSSLAAHATYAYRLWRRLVSNLIADPGLVRLVASGCQLSRLAVTEDSKELCLKLGLERKYVDDKYHLANRTEIPPTFYSRPLKDLDWLAKYQARDKSLRD